MTTAMKTLASEINCSASANATAEAPFMSPAWASAYRATLDMLLDELSVAGGRRLRDFGMRRPLTPAACNQIRADLLAGIGG